MIGIRFGHRRSLAERKMSCFKRLGQSVLARSLDRQITEPKVLAKILNHFLRIGATTTVQVS
jgi:hypothetical protein